MSRGKWKFTVPDKEDGKPIESADITDPQGRSIFSVDLGDFYGVSEKTAERICRLLNRE